jgi:hypothetical protein
MKSLLWFVLLASVVAAGQTESAPGDKKSAEAPKQSEASIVPVLDGGIGPCSAEFHISGANNKPIYNAQVHTLIKYGAFGVRKLDLQGSTNFDGKLKFTGLPDANKRAIIFDVMQGTKTAQRVFEPGLNCHPIFEVILQ